MKKIRYIFFITSFILCCMLSNANSVLAAHYSIDSQKLFTPSTFDTLELNITERPTVTVTGSTAYTVLNEMAADGISPRTKIQFSNTGAGQVLDTVITVNFKNCGTLNGRSIDLKLIYSDIVTNAANIDFRWSAFGTSMTSNNEWGFRYVEHAHAKIYFYYSGETEPIQLENAYLSIFSEDRWEGASSTTATNVYTYTTTNIVHTDSKTSNNGTTVYKDVYYGTTLEGNTEAGAVNCVSFQYENTDHIDIELYCLQLQGNGFTGYHLQYIPLTATVPESPEKSVSSTKAKLDEVITYTVNQEISPRTDDAFYYKAFYFEDVIDENLTYNNIKVYNQNGTDITATAGSATYNDATRTITYEFYSNYLKNTMNYVGEIYQFKITATVNSTSDSSLIENEATLTFNDTYVKTSNKVSTELYAKVIASYLDKNNIKIADDYVYEEKLLSEYTTQAKDIEGYTFINSTDNTSGTMDKNLTEVEYYYAKNHNIITKYVDENTGLEIENISSDSQTKYEGQSYDTVKKEIDEYTFTKDSGNTSGTVGETDIEVIYYYKKNSAGIAVKHIDVVTKEEIANSSSKTGLEGDAYTTSPETIKNYILEITPTNANGNMTVELITIVYEYRKQSDVITKYIDENTNQEIVTAITETYKEGDTYTTDKKSFDGYTFTKDSGNTSGTVARDTIEVIYYYKKNSAAVTTKHIDTVTKEEIANSSSQTGLEGEGYTTSAETIEKYVLEVTPTNATGTFKTTPIEVVYEYRKQSDVITKYIDENTNQEIVTAITETYKEGDTYTTDKKSFNGYTFTKDSGNTSGTVARNTIEVIYYYKKNSAAVTTKHIDTVTKEEIANSSSQTGLEGEGYTTSAETIEKYVLEVTPTNATGTFKTTPIEVVYEYRKQSDVITKYVDENTNQEIVTTITETYKERETYTTEKKSFDGYTFTKDSGNTSGTVERDTIEVIYYYKKISAGLEVKYIDQVTKEEIATSNEYSGLEKDPYTTTPKEVVGYELVLIPDNANGEMTVDKITVVYEYRLLSNVTTKYIDENTNIEMVEAVVDTYKEGDSYTTEKKSFDGYTFTKDSGNTSGVVERENIEVRYYYKKLAAGIEVKFIDQATGEEIATSVTKTGLENDPYTTEPKKIDGYELVVIPNNSSGKMKVEKTTIIYEYRKLSDVVTRYIDENTGLEIVDSVQNTYKEGDTYTTEKKSFDGYTFTKDTNNTQGTVQREDIEVIYYYKKTSAGIEAIYIDQVTGEEIAESVVKTGLENDAYTTEAKKIDGYELVVTPLNANGKMTVDKIRIVYEYRKLANVITKHIDANTEKEIVADVINTYKEGDEYQVLPQNLPGYTLVEEPEEKTGIMGREDITKVFKYKKISSGLVVKYVDEISNELLDEKTYTGNEKDIINLEELSFENYILTKRPADSTVELTVEPQERYFYYKKIVDLEVVGIDKQTGEELYNKIQSGVEGTEYTTEPIKIPGYDILEEPDNKNGIYKKDSDKVIYVYSRIAGNVVVRYVDKDTNEKLDGYEIKGYVGDEYTTEKKVFEDYNFVEVIGTPNGNLEEESKEIVYYYEKKTGKVVVIYVDTEGNVLFTEEQVGKVKEEYNIVEKEFDNYIVIERPENTSGKYIDGTIELKFVLEKLKGKIKVNFIDKEGNTLFESIITEGEIDEEYYLEALEKEGYQIVENAKIEVKYINGEIVIDVIYEKIEEPPATGDINVILYSLIILTSSFIIGRKLLKFKK